MPATVTETAPSGTGVPDQTATRRKFDGLYGGDESFDQTVSPEWKARIDPVLAQAPNPSNARHRIANTTFLSEVSRQPWDEVNRNLDYYRNAYARQVDGLKQPINDDDFYSLRNGTLQGEKRQNEMLTELHKGLFQAFRSGKDFNSTFSELQKSLSQGSGWQTKNADTYRQFAQNVWADDTHFADEHADEIATIAKYMRSARKGIAPGEEQDLRDQREEALRAVRGFNKANQNRALDFAAGGVVQEKQDEPGLPEKFARRIDRGISNLFSDAVATWKEMSNPGAGTGANFDSYNNEINRQLDKRITGEVDPLRGEGWISNGFLNAAQGLPSLVASLNPAGVAINGLAIRAEMKGTLIDKGVPESEAGTLATIIAVPEAALQMVSSKMIAGKVPFVSSWIRPALQEADVTGAALVSRFAKNLGIEAVGLSAISEAQSLTPLTVQATASILDKSIPGVGFKEFVDASLAPFTPEALASLAPMLVFGAGAGTFRDRAQGLAYAHAERELDALGFTEEHKRAFVDLSTPEKVQAEMVRLWNDRQLGTEKQKAAIEALNEATATTTQDATGPATVEKALSGGFIVKDSTGTPVGEAATPEVAAQIVAEVKKASLPPAPTLPDVTPERDGTPIPSESVALNKAAIKELRDYFPWLKELPDPTVERWADVLVSVKQKGSHANADQLAAEILSKPRPISAEEHMSMVLREAQLENQYDTLMEGAASASERGDAKETERLTKLADNVTASMDLVSEASSLTGTEIGRALNARRARIDRQTLTLAKIVRQAKITKGGSLTPEQTEQFQSLARQLKETQAIIDAQAEKIAKQQDELTKASAASFIEEGRSRRRAVAREVLGERRDRYKKELAALGYRVNDITNSIGLSVEAASIVSKLAETHIEEGVNNLKDLVAKIKAEIPDLSEQDIYNAVGRRTAKAVRAIKSEAQARIEELKKQAKLTAQINDALAGKFDEKTTKVSASEQVAALREQLAELRLQASRTTMDDAQLQRIHAKIDEVQTQLEGGFRPVKDATSAEPEEVKSARLKLVELQRLMRTTDAISDLEEQLRSGEFKVSAKEERAIASADLEAALVRRKQLQREVNQRIEALKPRTVTSTLVEGVDALRAFKATADMSASFRQALFLGVRRPGQWAKAFTSGVRAAFSQNTADAIELAILNSDKQPARQKAGLYISTRDVNISAREETFRSSLAEKIPGLGSLVRASERHMTVMVNLLRASSFDQFVTAHPEATAQQREAFASYVNAASGRGDLGRFMQAAGKLSLVFFSPRFAVSRFQLLYSPFKNIRDPIVRNEIAKDMLAFGVTGVSVLGLAALAGAKVGDDPAEPDFGKIVVGDTHIDIWGGLQQPMRLILQPVIAGAQRSGLGFEKSKIDPLDAGLRFLAYKMSPAVSVPLELARGKTVVGEDRTIPETLIRAITPLTIEATYDTATNTGSAAAAAGAGTLNFLGVGVNEQPPRKKKH